jgi:hypothetical protein
MFNSNRELGVKSGGFVVAGNCKGDIPKFLIALKEHEPAIIVVRELKSKQARISAINNKVFDSYPSH